MENMTLLLITLLILKHFVVDFVLQAPYQFLNKGIYGHPGGLLHSGLHAFFTIVILSPVCVINEISSLSTIIILGLLDSIIHYHADFMKVNIIKTIGLTADDEGFWMLTGFDQLLHYLTYIGIVWWIL